MEALTGRRGDVVEARGLRPGAALVGGAPGEEIAFVPAVTQDRGDDHPARGEGDPRPSAHPERQTPLARQGDRRRERSARVVGSRVDDCLALAKDEAHPLTGRGQLRLQAREFRSHRDRYEKQEAEDCVHRETPFEWFMVPVARGEMAHGSEKGGRGTRVTPGSAGLIMSKMRAP